MPSIHGSMFPTDRWRFEVVRESGAERLAVTVTDSGYGYLTIHSIDAQTADELAGLLAEAASRLREIQAREHHGPE